MTATMRSAAGSVNHAVGRRYNAVRRAPHGSWGGAGCSGGAQGGAVYNMGTLVLSNCTVAGNSATGGAGGVGGTNGSGVFATYPGAGGAGGASAGAGIFNAGKTRSTFTTSIHIHFERRNDQGFHSRHGFLEAGQRLR